VQKQKEYVYMHKALFILQNLGDLFNMKMSLKNKNNNFKCQIPSMLQNNYFKLDYRTIFTF